MEVPLLASTLTLEGNRLSANLKKKIQERLRCNDLHTSPGGNLHRVDRISMASALGAYIISLNNTLHAAVLGNA